MFPTKKKNSKLNNSPKFIDFNCSYGAYYNTEEVLQVSYKDIFLGLKRDRSLLLYFIFVKSTKFNLLKNIFSFYCASRRSMVYFIPKIFFDGGWLNLLLLWIRSKFLIPYEHIKKSIGFPSRLSMTRL